VPDVAIYATRKKLAPPSYAEGFDTLYEVRIAGDGVFEVHLPVVSLNATRLRAQVLSDPRLGRMRWAGIEIRDPRVQGPFTP
jgi:hypothetical protein